MTAKEFSDQFDVLYNNITSNQAPGLNEYEKSVFLTKAQDEIVKNYFSPESNPKGKGFDDSQKRQIDFSMLMQTWKSSTPFTTDSKLDQRSQVYKWPSNVMFVINESFYIAGGKPRQVIPLSFQDYTRVMSKPYKGPLKYQAWRLISGQSDGVPIVEIIAYGATPASTYYMRYIRKPQPIVLADFSSEYGEDISIDGVDGANSKRIIDIAGQKLVATTNNGVTTYSVTSDENGTLQAVVGVAYDLNNPCELHESIHQEILQRAVELAKIAWAGNQEEIASSQMHMTSGQRSE